MTMRVEEFTNKYKKGDILVFKEHWIIIFSGFRQPNNAIVYNALMSLSQYTHVVPYESTGIGYIEAYREKDVRYATNNEIQLFFDCLEKKHVQWDFKNKLLIDI